VPLLDWLFLVHQALLNSHHAAAMATALIASEAMEAHTIAMELVITIDLLVASIVMEISTQEAALELEVIHPALHSDRIQLKCPFRKALI